MNTLDILYKLNASVSKIEYSFLNNEIAILIRHIKESIKKNKIKADVFVGGSFAKKTLVKRDRYDIDIFIRFKEKYQNLSDKLEKIIIGANKKTKLKINRIHGSRDYFRMINGNIIFEIIPVLKINKPIEANNATDLSYFHVNYIKNNINHKITNEILLSKVFCKAHGVYGAESYVGGFSGYALECLIMHYKTFNQMIKSIVNSRDKLILDPAKHYKNTDEVLVCLNESKLRSPIVLIDPTWKERNVLAALNLESFNKFIEAGKEYLKKPNISNFIEKTINIGDIRIKAKKNKLEFLELSLKTNKQPGDIAGTKLKKFTNFFLLEIGKYFNVTDQIFIYNEAQNAKLFIMLKSKKQIIRIGPPIKLKKACQAFKKQNKSIFVKKGYLHSYIKIDYSARQFTKNWVRKYKNKIKEMGIIDLRVN